MIILQSWICYFLNLLLAPFLPFLLLKCFWLTRSPPSFPPHLFPGHSPTFMVTSIRSAISPSFPHVSHCVPLPSIINSLFAVPAFFIHVFFSFYLPIFILLPIWMSSPSSSSVYFAITFCLRFSFFSLHARSLFSHFLPPLFLRLAPSTFLLFPFFSPCSNFLSLLPTLLCPFCHFSLKFSWSLCHVILQLISPVLPLLTFFSSPFHSYLLLTLLPISVF